MIYLIIIILQSTPRSSKWHFVTCLPDQNSVCNPDEIKHYDFPSKFFDVQYTAITWFSFIADKIPGAIKNFPEFFDTDVMVHHEFVLSGQSVVIGHSYVQGLQRLPDGVQRKRRDKWQAAAVVSSSR
jgi:hypothetical protein